MRYPITNVEMTRLVHLGLIAFIFILGGLILVVVGILLLAMVGILLLAMGGISIAVISLIGLSLASIGLLFLCIGQCADYRQAKLIKQIRNRGVARFQ